MSDRRLSWADESPLWKVAMLVSLVSLIAVLVVPHEPGHWAFLASQASLLVPSRAQLAHQDGFDAMHAVDAGDFSTGHDNHLSRHRQAAPIAATAARTARVSRCSRVRVS